MAWRGENVVKIKNSSEGLLKIIYDSRAKLSRSVCRVGGKIDIFHHPATLLHVIAVRFTVVFASEVSSIVGLSF